MRVAINGMGRIGRATFKIAATKPELHVVALNDLTPADDLAYLLNYDTVYGRYAERVEAGDDALIIAAVPIPCSPNPIRRVCPGAGSASIWCSNAPGGSIVAGICSSTSTPAPST